MKHTRHRRTAAEAATASEAAKVERLHDRMQAKAAAVDHNLAAYVQATLEYGIELTRSEYRPLASRNWKIIQQFGVRLIRLLVFLTLALTALGALSYNTINEIQDGRRKAVTERCHAGERARAKLRDEVNHLPEPQRAQAYATLKPTEELVATIVPVTHSECRHALKAAGL